MKCIYFFLFLLLIFVSHNTLCGLPSFSSSQSCTKLLLSPISTPSLTPFRKELVTEGYQLNSILQGAIILNINPHIEAGLGNPVGRKKSQKQAKEPETPSLLWLGVSQPRAQAKQPQHACGGPSASQLASAIAALVSVRLYEPCLADSVQCTLMVSSTFLTPPILPLPLFGFSDSMQYLSVSLCICSYHLLEEASLMVIRLSTYQ